MTLRLLPGIDTRGDGGYIVVPPSRHITGNRYRWTGQRPTAEPPAWLLTVLERTRTPDVPVLEETARALPVGTREERYAAVAMDCELARLAAAVEGTRNDTLNRAAFNLGQLVAGGFGVGFLCGGARPPTEVMVAYIDANRDRFGVEPICEVLQFAPSTYYAAKKRQPSTRALRDAVLLPLILTLWKANYEVYGVRKMWKALARAGERVGRDQVARLMRQLGIQRARRGRKVRTTRPDSHAGRPPDLVDRAFVADRPNAL